MRVERVLLLPRRGGVPLVLLHLIGLSSPHDEGPEPSQPDCKEQQGTAWKAIARCWS